MRRQKAPSLGTTRRQATSPGRLGLVLLLAAVASFLLATGTASATLTHSPEPFSPLTGSGSGLTLNEVSGIAIDEATGNVFVTDGGLGHERVAILGAEGGAPVGLAAPYEIPGFSFGENQANGLAFDNSPTSPARGTLYVTERSTATVRKFTRDPTTERYEAAGEIAVPNGTSQAMVSVDRDGNLYVSAGTTLYKFSPSGGPPTEYDLSGLGNFSLGQVAVDGAGDLFVVFGSFLYRFPADGAGEIDPSVYTKVAEGARGVTIDPSNDHVFAVFSQFLIATWFSYGVEYDTSGETISEFGAEVIGKSNQVAVNSATERIYVADAGVFSGGHHDVNVFGPQVIAPTVGIAGATEVTGTKATLNGSIDPEGIAVGKCFFEWGPDQNGKPHYEHEVECEELPPADSAPHLVSASISGLTSNGKAYHFRLVAKNENGVEKTADKTFVTAATVATGAATEVGVSTATINGSVRPEGEPYASCDFEYGLTTTAGYEHTTSCNPPATEIAPDFSLHDVSLALEGLRANATYKFRLTATNSEGTLSGEVLTFTTQGPPQISEVRASFADQTSATLEAKIDPSGFGTSYRIDWGPTASYGHSLPAEFEPFIGSGEEPVRVKARLSGLSPATTYHYRVVATSEAGGSESTDGTLETLNSCGLPDGRCLELVSPRSLNLAAAPGRFLASTEIHNQASDEPGSLAYVIEGGLTDATKGGEVLYRSSRDAGSGWSSSVLSPPTTSRNEQIGQVSTSSQFLGLSPDLSCGVVASPQPLTDDPVAELMDKAGGANLYLRSATGAYTLITDVPPEELKRQSTGLIGEFELVGMSPDCSTVVFATPNHYAGIAGTGATRLYEWRQGHGLGYLGWVPGGAGDEVAEAKSGIGNLVTEDGSKVFFMADRAAGGNPTDPAEVGKQGVFARIDGVRTVDVSTSETSTPDTGATYWGVTPDGSKVYFTANAGLTTPSSEPGTTDLYEYDFGKPAGHRLTDLSVTSEPGGASVKAVVGIAADGSHAYFTSPGQLVAGRGKTRTQNEGGGTLSLYASKRGALHFVATVVENSEFKGTFGLAGRPAGSEGPSANVSANGRYLLFQSEGSVTGYDSGRAYQAYLYDADKAFEPTVCVSCRQDGSPTLNPQGMRQPPLARVTESDPLYRHQSLVIKDGLPKVFFVSHDRLAPGAVAGDGAFNLYEWSHGQVYLITPQAVSVNDLNEQKEAAGPPIFAGASEGGGDLYFFNAAALNWENPDGRYAAWDARAGGGFAQPAAGPPACDPDDEGGGSCHGPEAEAPASPTAGTTSFSGQGNVKPKKGKRKHRKRHHKHHAHHKRRHGKRHKGGKHGKRQGRKARDARRNGRAGK